MKVVLGISFLSLSNENIEIVELGKFSWRSYSAAKALITTSRIEYINKREFTKSALVKTQRLCCIFCSSGSYCRCQDDDLSFTSSLASFFIVK